MGGSGSFSTQVRNVGEATGTAQFKITSSNLILSRTSDPSYTGENELSWWYYLIKDESCTDGFTFRTKSTNWNGQPDNVSYIVQFNDEIILTCYYVYDNHGKFILTNT